MPFTIKGLTLSKILQLYMLSAQGPRHTVTITDKKIATAGVSLATLGFKLKNL